MEIKLFLNFLIFSSVAYSQTGTEIIRGRVTALCTDAPLADVLIEIRGPENFRIHTDTFGFYSAHVEAGTYSLLVQHPGYRNIEQFNVVVLSGKQQVRDFSMDEYKKELDTVIVTSVKNSEGLELDMWNLQRYAAVFYDPARMSASYSAVINTDDQANNVSIHGTSPNYIQWKVEGVEVVNPNHLENAGTINDKPALNGGGVSMFSAQILQNSVVQLSPFEPSSGNALSGIFDMKLRNGNNEKFENVIQASFLGLDACAEGPLSKKKTSSFLFNYRYSTVGLLSAMGINFGGDRIDYQDASLVLTYPLKHGQIRWFSILGKSSTVFRGEKDSTLFTQEKDLENIDYHSLTSINGINFITSINNSLLWRTVIACSSKNVDRHSQSSGYYPLIIPEETDHYGLQKISTTNYICKRFGSVLKIKAGTDANYFISEVHSGINDIYFANGRIADALIQPFVSFEGSYKELDYRIGLHGFYQPRINEKALQPRCTLTYNISKEQFIRASYGMSSQLQPFYLYLSNPENRSLKPTVCSAASIIHRLNFRNFEFKSELFYQFFSHVPYSEQTGFSGFNYFNEQITFPLESTGTAKTYGYDLTIEKNFNAAYIITSISIFRSSTDQNISGRFNSDHNISVTAGKEYTIRKNKFFSTDLRFFERNGFLEQEDPKRTSDLTYTKRLKRYCRADIRISYRKNRKASAVIWAIDVQNVSNHKNEAYHDYDLFTQSPETHYQLGLIPVLSYKILF